VDLVAWSRCEAQRRLGRLESRWAHTCGVVGRAQALAPTVAPADREVLVAAAWVHDIGYAVELLDTGFHPLDGARWLRECRQERLASLVAYHSGAWFEASARGLATAVEDFVEERSPVADLLTYCDLTIDARAREVGVSARLAEIETRYGWDSHVSRGMRAAARPLAALACRTETRIAAVGAPA
jgi:HD superfamily phosphodiesterase